MSEKTLKMLSWGVGVLALLYLGVTLIENLPAGDDRGDGPLVAALATVDTARLDSVVIESPSGERALLRLAPEGSWTVNGLRADSTLVKGLKVSIAVAEAGVPVATNPANHRRMGLAADSSWRVAFHAGGDPVTIRLGGSGPDFRSNYARLADQDEVYLLGGGLAGSATRTEQGWRDRMILRLDTSRVATLVVEREGRTLALSRSDGVWRSGGAEGPAVDPTVVAGTLSELSELQATGFPDQAGNADSTLPEASTEASADTLRRIQALDADGDTLTALELVGRSGSSWTARAVGDTLFYEVMSFRADRLVPADSLLLSGGAGG